MDPVIESTPIMGETEKKRARELTLNQLRPPRHLPGYEQERFLGRGAFGEVWVAIDSNNGRKVAIKYYHRRGGLDWSLLSREVEKLRYLFGDRHVVQLLHIGWDSDPPYYVMEYMENGSLEDLLREAPLPIERAISMFHGITVGLLHAHGKGILHCDLKPANIMLDQDGQPRLADFGQSRLSHEHSPALGTLFYMAPEQADLKAAPDARWDVYALGAVLYRMLTGEPPFRTAEAVTAIRAPGSMEERLTRYRGLIAAAPKPTAHRSIPGVDSELAHIIDKCLAVNPKERYPNIQAVLSALDARATRRARKPLLILGGVGPLLVLLLILGVSGYEFLRMIQTTEQEEKDRARDLNQLAARSEAERLGWEISARWQLLQQDANDYGMRTILTRRGAETQTDQDKLNQWLVGRQEYWGDRGGEGLRGTNWVVLDRAGYIRCCTEPDPTRPERFRVMTGVLGQYFGFRDYFHGRGQDMPITKAPPAADPPQPIRHSYRSAVFRQMPQRTFAVAYSTPIRSTNAADSLPIGVLVMICDLVGPTRLVGQDGRDRYIVMVDTGRDEHGDRGVIIRHPYQDDYKDHPEELPLAFAPEVVQKKEGFAGEYLDPVGRQPWGQRFAGTWIAAGEPVQVPIAPVPGATAEQRQSGWVVVVQETEAGVTRPIRALQGRLVLRLSLTLLSIMLLLGVLWLLVLVVLNAAPESRVVQFLRRRAGLRSGLSGASSASSGSSSGSGPSSGSVVSGMKSEPPSSSR
jgi:serine/threonine protein kinase